MAGEGRRLRPLTKTQIGLNMFSSQWFSPLFLLSQVLGEAPGPQQGFAVEGAARKTLGGEWGGMKTLGGKGGELNLSWRRKGKTPEGKEDPTPGQVGLGVPMVGSPRGSSGGECERLLPPRW